MKYVAIVLCLAGFASGQIRHTSFYRARVLGQTPIAWKTAESMILNRDEKGYDHAHIMLALGMEMPYLYHNVDLRVDGQPIYWTSNRTQFLADGWTKERALECAALVFKATMLSDSREINWAICSDKRRLEKKP